MARPRRRCRYRPRFNIWRAQYGENQERKKAGAAGMQVNPRESSDDADRSTLQKRWFCGKLAYELLRSVGEKPPAGLTGKESRIIL